MLAIEVVMASDPFDEVDAGVGGASAIEVGRRLARLATTAQVIVVTHLAQVAAFATNHLRVVNFGAVTPPAACSKGGDERIAEIARLLSGCRTPPVAWPTPGNSWDMAEPRSPVSEKRRPLFFSENEGD